MKVRCAGPQSSETLSEDVCFLMKSDEEETSSESNLSENEKKKGNAHMYKKVNANKAIWTNRSITKDKKDHIFTQSTILGSGTEWTILGGLAWSI
eukprot:5825653-Ditylum_brightwellii.AAC.1